MNATNLQPEFPVLRLLAWLTATTAAAGVFNALVLPGVFGGQAGIVEAAAVTAIAVFIAGVLCVFPFAKIRASSEIEKAFFLGMMIRFGVALAAWVVGVMAIKLPQIPFAVSLMLAYLPVLALETYYINRFNIDLHAWHQSQAKSNANQPPTAHNTSVDSGGSGHRSEKLA